MSRLTFPIHLVAPLYQEPQRFYHNIEHVHSLLREIDRISTEMKLSNEIRYLLEVAAWMHDVYYDPRATGGFNERMSTRMLAPFSQHVDITVQDTTWGYISGYSWLHDTILATAKHTEDQLALDPLAKLFLDIDLSGLGSSCNEYERNAKQIEMEYPGISELTYAEGRIAFLEKMQLRKSIFYTDHMRDTYEELARLNIKAELIRMNVRLQHANRNTRS